MVHRIRLAALLLLFAALAVVSWSGSAVTAQTGGASTVIAVGDIACDPTSPDFNGGQGDAKFCQQKATSDLAAQAHPDAVLVLGDNQYENGTFADFQKSYDPTWGRFKDITYPVPGNHEYLTPGATGYFEYFGARGAPPGGYYSFDVGAWHMIALNSECAQPGVGGCGVGSPQESWLVSDLAAHRTMCTLAFWHEPRFTSGRNGNHPAQQALWEDLYAFGAEIVLNGHDHIYERFAPQNALQKPDSNGIREFIVGGGGNNHQPNYGTIQPNSVVRDNTTYGVLKLTLRAGSYDWQYLPAQHQGNGTFTDGGTGTCHGINAGSESAAGPRAVPLVSSSTTYGTVSRFTVDYTSSRPGQGMVLFGPGSGCTNLVMTATGDLGAGSTHHSLVITGNDLPGTVGDSALTPGTTYSYETMTLTASGTETDTNGGKCYTVSLPRA